MFLETVYESWRKPGCGELLSRKDILILRESLQTEVCGDDPVEIDDPIFAPDSEDFERWYEESYVIETRKQKWIYIIWTGSTEIKVGKCEPNIKALKLRLQECERWCKTAFLYSVITGTDLTETTLHQILEQYFERDGEKFTYDERIHELHRDLDHFLKGSHYSITNNDFSVLEFEEDL